MSLPQNDDQRKVSSDSQLMCSCLTGPGRGAIAVVGLVGAGADQVVSQCFDAATPGDWIHNQIRYGRWTGFQDEASAGESVVVIPLRHDRFEIHCHGGPAAVDRILGDLVAGGAQRASSRHWFPQECLLIEEANSVLSHCLTARTAATALDQVRGAMVRWADRWRQRLRSGTRDLETLRAEAMQITADGWLGTRLHRPLTVAVIGPPNVGKSSLVNAMLGYQRSIIFDAPGTTRDVLRAETVIDGWPLHISDTAGIRHSGDAIEAAGVARARQTALASDLVLFVTDPEHLDANTPYERVGLGEMRLQANTSCGRLQRHFHVLNKCDLMSEPSPAHLIPTCTLSDDGTKPLIDRLSAALSAAAPVPSTPVPVNERQIEVLNELCGVSSPEMAVRSLGSLLGWPA